jgi:hypothetical protein
MNRATRDSLIVGVVALVVRLPAFFAPQPLGFDDGQFAMSVIAMRHGGLPFREIFSSQGPLFLPIAWLGDLVSFRTIDSPRFSSLLAGVALAVLVLHLARRLTGPGAARFAALLVALSGSVLWTTVPLTSDGIGAALTVATALAAVAYWGRPSVRRAIVIGVLAGAALAVKSLLVIPGLVAAALWVLLRRRVRDIAAVPVVAVVVVLLVSAPWGLGRVYDQYVRYHTDAVADRPVAANLHKLVSTFVERDLPLLVAGVVTLVLVLALVMRHRRTATADSAGAPLTRALPDGTALAPWFPVLVWLVLSVMVVLTESPMWRNHVAHVAVPFALLVGVGLGVGASAERYVAVAAGLALLAAPWTVVHLGEILRPQEPTGNTARLEQRLRALPAGAMAISDTPGLVWRASRRVPDRYVDVSILRITSPTKTLRLTEDDIVHDARRADVCAVVRWSDKRFTQFPELGRRLRQEGYRPELRRPRSPEVLWRKVRCRPGSGRADRTTAAVAPARSPG